MKKVISLASALVLVLALMPVRLASANVIGIGTAQELWNIRNNLSGTYRLTGDINLSGYNGGNWIPIGGNGAGNFTGTLDGQGFAIRNMYITGSFQHIGLFGVISGNAVIENLGIENMNIGSWVSSAGNAVYAGGIAGRSSSGSTTIRKSYVIGDILVYSSTASAHAGGIIGEAMGNPTVEDCYSRGYIEAVTFGSSSSFANVGGIFGYLPFGGTIRNCYSTVAMNGTASILNQAKVGGICGWRYGTITNSYWNSDSLQRTNDWLQDPKKGVGDGSDTATARTTAQMTNSASAASVFAGFDFNTVWEFRAGVNNGYPVLRKPVIPDPTGSIWLSQSMNTITFPSAVEGYSAITPEPVYIYNTGDGPTGALTATVSGANPTAFTLSQTSFSSILPGWWSLFEAAPNTGLPPGTYTARITVGSAEGVIITPDYFDVSFTVLPLCPECGKHPCGCCIVCKKHPCECPQPPVLYLDANGVTQICTTYTLYTGQTTLTDGWYAVFGEQVASERVRIIGDVHIILADHGHLDATGTVGKSGGIRVDDNNSLTVYAQSVGGNMGSLTAECNIHSGIGGDDGIGYNTITINGGVITSTSNDVTGSGIGGTFSAVTINGGEITAMAGVLGNAAAIGGYGGTVSIPGFWEYWVNTARTPPSEQTGSGVFPWSADYRYIKLVPAEPCPGCNHLPCKCLGPPDTCRDGIFYNAPLIVPATENGEPATGFGINLTAETLILPSDYIPAVFSTDGGKKWKAVKGEQLTTKFARLLNKGLDLQLANEASGRSPAADARIIKFQKIGARPKIGKFAVNYGIYADATGLTAGGWAISTKENVRKAVKDLKKTDALVINWQVGAAETPKSKGVGGLGYGAFCTGCTDTCRGIPVLRLEGGKPERSGFFVRTEPRQNGMVYTAASRAKRVRVTSELRATRYSIRTKNEKSVLSVKANTYVSLDGGAAKLYGAKETIELVNVTKIEVWQGATGKKPVSKKQTEF
jgi:hypothetical protein